MFGEKLNGITLGLISGIGFGIFSALIMVPMHFESGREKWEAVTSAFVDRFMIGLLIPNVIFGLDPILTGLFLGVGLSIPSAIISRAYAPIILIGALGGLIIGYISKMVLF